MKILAINGSPRTIRSTTRKLAGFVLEGAAKAGAETDMIDLADYHVTPCTACEACSLNGICVNDDDVPSHGKNSRVLFRAEGGGGPPFCKIRNCCQAKKILGCWECTKDPARCEKLTFFAPVHGEAHLKNIRILQKKGIYCFISGKRNW